MKTINQRTKGHSFERFIAKLLKPFFPQAKRHLEYQMSSCDGYDIDGTTPFKIQCKAYNKIAVYKWLEEIKINSNNNEIPLLICKADHKKPIIIGYLDDIKTQLFSTNFIYEKENPQ